MDHLESFIAECDRRTELAKKRLAETQEEISAEVSAKVPLMGALVQSVVLWVLGVNLPSAQRADSTELCIPGRVVLRDRGGSCGGGKAASELSVSGSCCLWPSPYSMCLLKFVF